MTEWNSVNSSAKEEDSEDAPMTTRVKICNEEEESDLLLARQLKNEEKVLTNHLVLKEIIKYLNNHDLLTVRRVNRLWSQIGASIGCDRRSLCTKFKYSRKYRCFLNDVRDKLSNLTDRIKTSKGFPCSSFQFLGGDVGAPDVQEFFSFHGNQIKYFGMNSNFTGRHSYTSIETLRSLLRDLPNLEYLTMESTPREWKQTRGLKLFLEPAQLPKLKTLELGYNVHHGVLTEILTAAINLTQTIGFDPKYAYEFVSTGQLSTVRHWTFFPSHESTINSFIDVTQDSHLHSLDIYFFSIQSHPDSWPRVASTLQKILLRNKPTLKRIGYLNPVAFLAEFQLPVLDKLKEIRFVDLPMFYSAPSSIQDHRLLPDGQRLTKVFPNLAKIIFDIHCPSDQTGIWNDLFHPLDTLPSVKELVVRRATGETGEWIENMGVTFPNVETLDIYIENVTDFPTIGAVIWSKFARVTSVKISFYNFDYNRSFRDEMDSTITGVSAEVCVQLRKNFQTVSVQDLENLREKPGICHLKDLRSLEINTLKSDWDADKVLPPIFSYVSGIFGFGLRKEKLKVTLRSCHEKNERKFRSLLDPVEQYIYID